MVTWSDDHRSVFRYGWLLARSFRYAEQCLRARWNGRAAKLWKSNLTDNVLNVKFDQVRETEILNLRHSMTCHTTFCVYTQHFYAVSPVNVSLTRFLPAGYVCSQ